MLTLNWQPLLQTWKRYAAVKTAIIERVCYSATLCLCRTVCPLNSVSTCFAISRVQLYVKAQILLTIKQWFLVHQLLLWALTARTSLREQTSVASSPAVRGKMPCWHKSLLTLVTSHRKWCNKNRDICCMTQHGHAAWVRTEHRMLFLVERKSLFCVSVSEDRKKDIVECSNIVTHYPRKSLRKIP